MEEVLTINTKDSFGKEPHYQDRIYDAGGVCTALTVFAPPMIMEFKQTDNDEWKVFAFGGWL